jgi:hypothetical protein
VYQKKSFKNHLYLLPLQQFSKIPENSENKKKAIKLHHPINHPYVVISTFFLPFFVLFIK